MSDLNEWITAESLEECAGHVVFKRGVSYFNSDAVSRLLDYGDRVSARVEGTETYRAELWTDGEELAYDCTCPHAEEGNFCKHCVALGLAFLALREGEASEAQEAQQEIWAQLKEFLAEQPPEELAEWLLEAAQRDEKFYQRMLAEADIEDIEGDYDDDYY